MARTTFEDVKRQTGLANILITTYKYLRDNKIIRGSVKDPVFVSLPLVATGGVPEDIDRKLSIKGRNPSVAATGTWVDIWEGGAAIIPEPSPLGETINIISTSASDSISGTGVQKVRVEYLNTLNELTYVDVALNGLTAVQAVGITNMTDVINFYSIQNGTNHESGGNIKIFKLGSPTTVYNIIPTGNSSSQSTLRHLLPASTFYLTSYVVSSNTKGADVSLKITCNSDNEVFENVYLIQIPLVVTDAPISIPLIPAIIVPGTAKMKVSARTTVNNTQINVWLNGYVKI